MITHVEKTDIINVRHMALLLLHTPMRPTPIDILVGHPFATTWVTLINDLESKQSKVLDLRDPNDLQTWLDNMTARINTVNLENILHLIRPPYILFYLKLARDYISDQDLGHALSQHWSSIESISSDPNVSLTEIQTMFKSASKLSLMSEKERVALHQMPDQVTLYRGVTAMNQKQYGALSWTLDKNIARQFALRFKSDYAAIWKITVPKRKILCYFDRGEQECIMHLTRKEALGRSIEQITT